MSEFSNRSVCDAVAFFSHTISPQTDGVDAVLSLQSGAVDPLSYSLSVKALDNHLVLANKNTEVFEVDTSGNVNFFHNVSIPATASGVTSVNGVSGVVAVEGSNGIVVTAAGQTITVANSANIWGPSVLTLAGLTFDATSAEISRAGNTVFTPIDALIGAQYLAAGGTDTLPHVLVFPLTLNNVNLGLNPGEMKQILLRIKVEGPSFYAKNGQSIKLIIPVSYGNTAGAGDVGHVRLQVALSDAVDNSSIVSFQDNFYNANNFVACPLTVNLDLSFTSAQWFQPTGQNPVTGTPLNPYIATALVLANGSIGINAAIDTGPGGSFIGKTSTKYYL